MKLHCPNCTHELRASEIDVVKTIAKCASCNNLFDFTAQLDEAPLPVPYHAVPRVPGGIDLVEYADSMEITVRQTKSKATWALLAPLLGVVFPFVFVWFSGFGLIPLLVFASITVIAEFGVIALGLSRLLHKIHIGVRSHALTVERRPLHVLLDNKQSFDPLDVEQLYVQRRNVKTRTDKRGRQTHFYNYSVVLRTHAGTQHELIPNLHSADLARYLERRIEQYLGIENRRVREEVVA